MKGNFLEREYFYDANMKKDEKVAIAGNCLEQLASIIMKNTFDEVIDYYAMSLEDLSFHVRFDKQGYFIRSALKCNDTGIEKGLWNITRQVVIGNEEEAVKALNDSLRKYDYAIVRTVDGYLEFSKNYDETSYYDDKFDYTTFPEKGHVFLIIGEDENNYYYVDQPSEINIKRYAYVRGRRDIGIYPKESFFKAFRLYLGLYFIEFNEDKIYHSYQLGRQIIRQSVDNFYGNYSSRIPENDSFSVLGGKAALYKIKEMLEQKRFVLDKKVFNPTALAYKNHTIGDEFLNGMTSIINRREALNGYFLNNGCENVALKEDIRLWKRAKEVLMYQYNVGGVILGKNEIDYDLIIATEEKVFSSLV